MRAEFVGSFGRYGHISIRILRQVFENMLLRSVFAFKREEVTEYGENSIMISFQICT
jgi:hypothetical protein